MFNYSYSINLQLEDMSRIDLKRYVIVVRNPLTTNSMLTLSKFITISAYIQLYPRNGTRTFQISGKMLHGVGKKVPVTGCLNEPEVKTLIKKWSVIV